MTRKQIIQFVVTLLLITWAVQIAILSLVGAPDSDAAIPFMLLVMFLPGLLGLAYTLRYKAVRQSIGWLPKNVTPLLLAVVIPLFVALTILAILAGFDLGLSEYFKFEPDGVTIASGPWTLGTGAQSYWFFFANLLLSISIYAAITGFAAIGEEYGWRGVLQNAMIKEFGFVPGVALLGTVWAFWHAPLIIAGYNYAETPLLGAFVLLPALLIGASFVMAWLTIWNRSFWPAVLMHGAINSVYDSMITKVSLSNGSSLTVPLIEIAVFALIAGLVVYFFSRRGANTLPVAMARSEAE